MTRATEREICRYLSSVVLLLVEPKPDRRDELVQLGGDSGGRRARPYNEEENAAYLVPSDGRLGPKKFALLVERLKPAFLSSELERFNVSTANFPLPITAETFDTYFDLVTRDQIVDVQSMSPEVLVDLGVSHLQE